MNEGVGGRTAEIPHTPPLLRSALAFISMLSFFLSFFFAFLPFTFTKQSFLRPGSRPNVLSKKWLKLGNSRRSLLPRSRAKSGKESASLSQ